jgi:hypothetical protein
LNWLKLNQMKINSSLIFLFGCFYLESLQHFTNTQNSQNGKDIDRSLPPLRPPRGHGAARRRHRCPRLRSTWRPCSRGTRTSPTSRGCWRPAPSRRSSRGGRGWRCDAEIGVAAAGETRSRGVGCSGQWRFWAFLSFLFGISVCYEFGLWNQQFNFMGCQTGLLPESDSILPNSKDPNMS